MIDKIWSDWQNKSPKNRYAYGGGSSEATANYAQYVEFPTGIPPYPDVSARSYPENPCATSNDAGLVLPLKFASEIPGDGLWEGVQIWDMMDTTGDTLCYVYA